MAADAGTRNVEHGADGDRLRLELIGGFRLVDRGVLIRTPQNVQRLLAFVALQGRPILRSYVAGSLWPDVSDQRAAANLRSALWRVPEPADRIIDVTAHTIAIQDGVVVDHREALEHCHRLLEHRGAEDVRPTLASLLGGDLLPGWRDEYVVVERERLRQLHLHALEAVAGDLIAVHRVGEAVDIGLAAVAADPLRESVHRAVIAAHLLDGNVAEAYRHYETYRENLWTTLRIQPSPIMCDLVASLLVGA